MAAPLRIRPFVVLALLLLAVGAAAESAHERASCARCHGMGGASSGAVAPQRASCLDCHGELLRDPLGLHPAGERGCTDCHAFHEPADAASSRDGFESGHCAACHFPGSDLGRVSSGHRRAADLYHSGDEALAGLTPSEACMACHGEAGSIEAGEPAPYVNEHASHAFGVTLRPGFTDPRLGIHPVLDPRIRLFDERIECATCHRLSSPDEDLLVVFEQRYGLCQGCHDQGTRREDGVLALLP